MDSLQRHPNIAHVKNVNHAEVLRFAAAAANAMNFGFFEDARRRSTGCTIFGSVRREAGGHGSRGERQ